MPDPYGGVGMRVADKKKPGFDSCRSRAVTCSLDRFTIASASSGEAS